MAQAQGSRHSISYIPEVTFGVTPSTPSMIEFRSTGTTLAVRKDNFVSNEIRNDRQITDLRHGAKRADGDLNFELSYGAFDDWLEGALMGAWSTNVLKAGVTPKSFTVERAHADISEYHPFKGVMVNTMSLNVVPNAMITGAFGVIGAGAMTAASSPLDASVTAATGHPPFDGFTGSLTEGGSAALVTSISLELNNNLNPVYVVGSDIANNTFLGRSILTGSLSALFETEAMLNKFLAETESSLSVTLEGLAGGDLTIAVPLLKYTSADYDVSNADDGILLNMNWQALRDDSEATNMKITRIPA